MRRPALIAAGLVRGPARSRSAIVLPAALLLASIPHRPPAADVPAAPTAQTRRAAAPQPLAADLLLAGGRVVDGTGTPWVRADVAIQGDTIVSVGRGAVKAARTIDVAGRIVAPGFIDMHAHSEYGLVADPRALSKITQGVTTEVLGEHLSAGPVTGRAVDDPMMVAPPVRRDWTTLGGFFERLERQGIGVNVVSYVGAGQVRACVVGYERRAATPAELEEMKRLVAQAMEEGAFGLSSGLAYVPNAFASTEELVELARVAGAHGGVYVTHLRGGLDGLREGLRIAREAGVPIEIHHINSTASRHIAAFAAEIERARGEGADVTANAYPYTAGWTYLRSLLPSWALEGGTAAMLERLARPADRARIVEALRASGATPAPDGAPRWTRVVIASPDPSVDGLTVEALGRRRGRPPEEALVDLLIERKGEGFQIAVNNTEEALAEALRLPWVAVGSDGSALAEIGRASCRERV
mgnify:CR=1 FL=1